MFKAISEGETKIETLAVACIDAEEQPIFPCGVSRQRMSEFGTEDVIVVHKGESKKYKFEEVLPFDNKIKFKVGPRRPGDSKLVVANPNKFIKTMSWKPKYNNLKYILKTAYEWEKKITN